MSLVQDLKSYGKKDMYAKVFLQSGVLIEGHILKIGSHSLTVRNNELISGISFDAMSAWQLATDTFFDGVEEVDTDTIDEDTIQITQDSSVYEHDTLNQIEDFVANDSITNRLKPERPIFQIPDALKVAGGEDRSIWDSVFSKYQRADTNDDTELFESLANDFSKIIDRYPESGIYSYNTGCLKLKAHNYPDAGEYFDDAFNIDGNRNAIRNAIYAYLVTGDNEKVLLDISKYFYATTEFYDTKLWFEFCRRIRNGEEYQVFLETILSILNEHDMDDDLQNNINWLFGSTMYVFKNTGRFDHKFIAFNRIVESDDESSHYDAFMELINDIYLEVKDFDLGQSNKEFNKWLISSNESRITTRAQAESNTASENMLSGNGSDESKLFDKFTYELKKGHIYRCIPSPFDSNVGYGFIRDDDRFEEVHFNYSSIIGDIYLTASDFLSIPVLYKAIKSTKEDVSVKYTASLVIPEDMLTNLSNLAEQFAKEKDYRSALLEIETILQYDPDNTDAKYKRERWTKLHEKHAPSSSTIQLQPRNENEWETYGYFLLEQGQFSDAGKAFTHISDKTSKSCSWYNKGISCLQTLRYDEAIEHFSHAIKKNKFYYHAFFARGLAYLRKGVHEKALEDFDLTLKIRPDYADAWAHRARTLQMMGKNDDALSSYDTALIIDDDNWDTLAWKAGLLIRMNKVDKALKIINNILDNHDPEYAPALFAKGYALQKQKQYDEALIYLDKSLAINPENIKAITKRAYVLACLGNYDMALQEIDRAISKKRSNPKTWYYKGVINYLAGNYTEAGRALDKSLEIKPGVSRVESCKNKLREKLGTENLTNDGFSSNDAGWDGEQDQSSNIDLQALVDETNRKVGGIRFQ